VADVVICEVHHEDVEKEINGSKIKRHGSKDNPAYFIKEDDKDAHVLKLKSELA